MKLKELEKTIRPNFIKGYLLSTITIPFLPVMVLKFFYNMPGDTPIHDSMRVLINQTFQFLYIQVMWPITPDVEPYLPLTIDHLLGGLIVLGFILGTRFIIKARTAKVQVRRIKEKAYELDMIDELREQQ